MSPSHVSPGAHCNGPVRIHGIDFTSAPRRAKPITWASATLAGDRLRLDGVDALVDFGAFTARLATPGPWLAGFDFPFGLPRTLIESAGLPDDWAACAAAVAAMPAADWRALLADFRAARPAGGKEPPRLTDRLAGAQSAMKAVNPPVALMYRAGAARLAEAGLHVAPCRPNGDGRVALECYPALLARRLIGRGPYKGDGAAGRCDDRRARRAALLDALHRELPTLLGLRLATTPAQRAGLLADDSGDRLDALLCAVLAAWAAGRPDLGVAPDADPREGWIVAPPDWLSR